ncbi:MAG: pilus assembly protein TadG-related protein [Anaerolineales bacterium]|jgi:Flp pilus assembly protein TadG
MRKQGERGQTTVFFVLVLTGLLLLTAVGVEIGRIVYARGEVGKAADAAALAAASRIDVALYQETGEIRFLPDVYATAQEYASMNSAFLQRRNIGVAVTGITVDAGRHEVYVTVSANLSSLIPGILAFQGEYGVTGYSEVMMNGR